jgi:histidinol-phosphate aminotransferase
MTLERIVKPHIRALAPYEPGKPPEELERELGIEGAIKLASNESPIGPSPRAIAAVRDELAGVHRYPDGACFDLRAALAKRFAIAQDQLVFGCGADELLELVAKSFLGRGDEAVFAWPSFAMYPIVVKGMGADPVTVPLDGALVHDLPRLRAAITPRTRVVFVCNPNNPTGTSVGAAAFDAFVASLPRELVLVVDEAYREFARRPDFPDAIAWVAAGPARS